MTALEDPGPGGPGLLWLVRRYAGVALLVLGLTTAVGTTAAAALAGASPYEGTALVIATELEIEPEQLPRFGQSVFASGAVAREVVAEEGLSQDPRTLLPDVVDLDPVPESIAFMVRGRAEDPDAAAAVANAAARAFVAELNRAGPTVGTFSVHTEAVAPMDRIVRGPGRLLGAIVSAVAGAVLALVSVWVLFGLRRPVLSGSDAALAAAAPLVAEVELARAAGSQAGHAPGSRRLQRWLSSVPSAVVTLVGPEGSGGACAALAAAVPVGRGGPRLLAQDAITSPPGVAACTVLLVVELGTPAARLTDVRRDLSDDEVLGVVLVRWRRRPLGVGRRVHLAPRPLHPAPEQVAGVSVDRGVPTGTTVESRGARPGKGRVGRVR